MLRAEEAVATAGRRGWPPAWASNRWVVLALVTTAFTCTASLQAAPAALAPLLIAGLGITRQQLGYLSAAIWGGMFLGNLPVGALSDRFGERAVIGIGVAAMGLIVIAASLFPSFWVLFGLFLLAAVAASSPVPGGSRAIATSFEPRLRGLAMGIRQAGFAAGGLVAALVLPAIAVRAGWPVALRVASIAAIVVAAGFYAVYRERWPHDGRPPALRLRRLLGYPAYVRSSLYSFMMHGGQGATVGYLAIFLHESFGLSPVLAAGFLALIQTGSLLGRVCLGALSDRVGSRSRVMAGAAALGAACAFGFSLSPASTPVPVLALITFAAGVSILGWQGLTITLAAETVPLESAATAVGASLTFSFTSLFLVSPQFGLVADMLHGYRMAWGLLAGWILLAALMALSIQEPPQVHSGR